MKPLTILTLLPSLVSSTTVLDWTATGGQLLRKRQTPQGDGKTGSADSTQADLLQRPAPRFPFPITKFPRAKETVVLQDAFYVPAGATFDGGMKRYERPEGSCNEQAEGTDADTVFNLLPGSTIRNVIIGKHQSEGIHALGDAWVENGKSLPVYGSSRREIIPRTNHANHLARQCGGKTSAKTL